MFERDCAEEQESAKAQRQRQDDLDRRQEQAGAEVGEPVALPSLFEAISMGQTKQQRREQPPGIPPAHLVDERRPPPRFVALAGVGDDHLHGEEQAEPRPEAEDNRPSNPTASYVYSRVHGYERLEMQRPRGF